MINITILIKHFNIRDYLEILTTHYTFKDQSDYYPIKEYHKF